MNNSENSEKAVDNDDLWHFDGATYRLVNPVRVSYPKSRRVEVDGRMVFETLPPLEFMVVTAWPVPATS